MISSQPDEELVQKARNGDKKAFGDLVNRYYQMVHVVALGIVHQHELARDIAQEVFLKVYRDMSKFEGKSKFKTWLYRVAVNAAIDEHRKKRFAVSLDGTDATGEEDEAPVTVTDPKRNAREELEGKDQQELVRKAMLELSDEHRAILHLREWEDLSYDEIASILEIEEGTVMSRLFYARKKLKEVLDKSYMKEIK